MDLHQHRLGFLGTLHHVIIRDIERQPIVADNHDRNAFVRRMGQLSIGLESLIYAWALTGIVGAIIRPW